ncbi:MAG: DUF3842 family protein [Deltaproteobacteria bacterium]|nr:DUF3842 family protein [Deltaproteobacteria bacterium]
MVMDGQGGGIGASIIKGLRERYGNDLEIFALGTNSIATSKMMKSGANKGATGENAIIRTCMHVEIIVGSIAIIMANAMMGEVTSRMTEAVCSCHAKKILIPLTQENVNIVGTTGEPLPHMVQKAVKLIEEV